MPSGLKTERLGLNLWASTDRPVRADFNHDNAALESTVGDHIEDNSMHLTRSDCDKLRDTYIIRVLQGTDAAEREVTLDFAPSVVLYYAVEKPPACYMGGVNKIYSAVCAKETGGSGGIELAGSTVIITHTTTGDIQYDLNNSSRQYVLIAVR